MIKTSAIGTATIITTNLQNHVFLSIQLVTYPLIESYEQSNSKSSNACKRGKKKSPVSYGGVLLVKTQRRNSFNKKKKRVKKISEDSPGSPSSLQFLLLVYLFLYFNQSSTKIYQRGSPNCFHNSRLQFDCMKVRRIVYKKGKQIQITTSSPQL